jgi:hydrogenase maturation protein HypF
MDQRENKRLTKRITVFGIVQGVGFRPLVYRIAKSHGILGTVRNIGGLVEILVQSTEQKLTDFLQDLKEHPGGGEILAIEMEDVFEKPFVDFTIIHSSSSEEVAIIPPDLPVCPDCQEELYTESDRRFHNPFISCMSCGPRYTIMEVLPYDRNNTTMVDFAMCPSCNEEYTHPESRRFHAQTISCNDCGPYLIMKEHKDQEALKKAITILKDGGILAVKGIGGYHFVCSPFMEETVSNLRKLKGREEKPFAVMFETIQSVEEFCFVTKEERELLETKARPIVLLYIKDEESMAPSTNKGSIYCGAFLPYTPLQMMLTKHCGPLIMTSANIANQPIIKDDEVILAMESPYLDGVLYNERRIVRSVDDSVAKIIDRKPQLIRRSRGYVPYPVFISASNLDKDTYSNTEIDRKVNTEVNAKEYAETDRNINSEAIIQDSSVEIPRENNCVKSDKQILAMGGDLKAAFCLYKKGNAVVSQYFGDLEENSIQESYQTSISDLSGLLKITPELVVCDLHPNYFSSRMARSYDLPVLPVQHHHAHVTSVMAEHDLKGKVIGIAFDGTGYGTDGNVWGSEFLICEGADFIRAAHLSYVSMLGGDASMKDARKTATCFLIDCGIEDYVTDERKDIIKAALKHKVNSVLTSSMGRLFDAVASILGLSQINSYEGECAALLEKAAVLAIRQNKKPEELSFAIHRNSEIIEIDPKPVLEGICNRKSAKDTGSLALGFHYAVADMILQVCELIKIEQNSNIVALSGGVFQNTILTEQASKLLREHGFRVYLNTAVPPNDGSISLGQAYIGLLS